MPPMDLFPDEPDDTRVSIMKATYEALCTHGYADLTIEKISQGFPKSKSLLYHHYEGKDELLVDFLSYLLENFEQDLTLEDTDSATVWLQCLFDHVFPSELPDERRDFTSALIELRAQAPHDPAYREQFTKTDRLFKEQIADVIRWGIEQDEFRDVDPEQVAQYLHATINGVMLERVTSDDPSVDAIRNELEAYVEARLLPDE